MAEKDSTSKEARERILNIPLRREWLKVPRNERGKRAMSAIRGFVSKHMKSYDIKISQKVNEKIWTRGIQKPPQNIRVKVSVSEGAVQVRLPEEIVKKPEKKEKEGRMEKVKEVLETQKGLPLGGGRKETLKKGKKKEPKTEEKKPEKPKGTKDEKKKPEEKKK